MDNNIIRFSKTKRYTGYWNGNMVEIKDTTTEKSFFVKYNVKNQEEAEKIITEKILELDKAEDFRKELMGNTDIEKLMCDYKIFPTPEKENVLKIILFLLKKMEYVNKKLFGVKKIIEQFEELGIKLDKKYNPFEQND